MTIGYFIVKRVRYDIIGKDEFKVRGVCKWQYIQ